MTFTGRVHPDQQSFELLDHARALIFVCASPMLAQHPATRKVQIKMRGHDIPDQGVGDGRVSLDGDALLLHRREQPLGGLLDEQGWVAP